MNAVKNKYCEEDQTVLDLSVKLVFDAVGQGLPGGFHDVFRHPDGPPFILLIARFDQDANLGLGPFIRSQDADFIIQQFHFLSCG